MMIYYYNLIKGWHALFRFLASTPGHVQVPHKSFSYRYAYGVSTYIFRIYIVFGKFY